MPYASVPSSPECGGRRALLWTIRYRLLLHYRPNIAGAAVAYVIARFWGISVPSQSMEIFRPTGNSNTAHSNGPPAERMSPPHAPYSCLFPCLAARMFAGQ